MTLISWIRNLFSRRPASGPKRPRRRTSSASTRQFRPWMEPLEDRTLLTAGALDPTFGLGLGGKVTTDFSTVGQITSDAASGLAVQGDGQTSLEAVVSSQGAINIGSNGALVLHLAIGAGQLSGKDTVASLFSGAAFTIKVQGSDGTTSETFTPTVRIGGDGHINLTLEMSAALKQSLGQVYRRDESGAVKFNISATSTDGNYELNEDTLSKLLNNGPKLSPKGA